MSGERFLKKQFNLHSTLEVVQAAKRTAIRTGERVPDKPEAKIANYLQRFQEILEREDEAKKQRGIGAFKKVMHKLHIIKPEDVPYRVFELEQDVAEEQGHGRPEITKEFKQRKIEQIQEDQMRSLDRWIDYLASPDAAYPLWVKYWALRSVLKMGKYDKATGQFKKRSQDTVTAFPMLNPRALAITVDVMVKKLVQAKIKEQLKNKNLPPDKHTQLEKKLADNQITNSLVALDDVKDIVRHQLIKQAHKEHTKLTDEELDRLTQQQVDEMSQVDKEKLIDQTFQQLLNAENFSQLYAQTLERIGGLKEVNLQNINGKWVKYEQGSDHRPLVESLQNYPLEWCTAGESTARQQLANGDFYVYYSEDENGGYKIPRLAIRMNGKHQIGEIRGIEHHQNIDQYIQPVLDSKLKEFGPEGEKYQQKSADMKRMSEITEKFRNGQELSADDLRFVYEIDRPIEGFGNDKDPRIKEILEGRDQRQDLAKALNCRPEQIALTKEEALSGDIEYYAGKLYLGRLTSAEGLELPKQIGGSLNLSSLKSAEGLKLPEQIGGDLYLNSLTSVEGLELPKQIGCDLYLNSLTSAEGLKLPKEVVGGLDLSGLTSAEGLKLPEQIGGYLDLSSLISAEGLKLPEQIGSDFYLNSLVSAEGLDLSRVKIGRIIYLINLDRIEKEKLKEKYTHLKII